MDVSVIITCFNYGSFVDRAIRSCFNQNFSQNKFEIIVVNDASTDETKEVLENYGKKIQVINLPKNMGLSYARNTGIKKASGRFIINLDADDYFDENILLVESLFLYRNHNFSAVSCDYFTVDEYERHIKKYDAEIDPIACGIMFRKDRLFEIGLYDETLSIWEEKDIRKKFIKNNFFIYNIKLPLYRYRRHGKNMTKLYG